jgi:hypothetical protein
MEKKEDKARSGMLTIMGIIIVALLILLADQRNKNDQAQEEFAYNTASADIQNTISSEATQKVENKIRNCIRINEVARFVNTEQCVIGSIYKIVESTEKRDAYTAPEVTFAYFISDTFYLFSNRDSGVFLNSYAGDCVMVWGKILLDNNGTPAMSIYEHLTYDAYINIEKLPDNICYP